GGVHGSVDQPAIRRAEGRVGQSGVLQCEDHHCRGQQPRGSELELRQRRSGDVIMDIKYDRRSFLKTSTVSLGATVLPLTMVELAFAKSSENFTFAYISDSHIQQIKGTQFVRNWDRGLIRAIAETNLLTPKPDFIMYGGDLAQMGNKPELDHGAEMLS